MIKLFRIDDRLIHGQVAFAWTRATSTDHIIVANDEAFNNNLKKATLKLAKPAGTSLTVVPVSKFNKAYEKYQNKNLMIIVENTLDAKNVVLQLSKEEIPFVNIGGIRPDEDRKTVASGVSLSSKDIDNLNEINSMGIDIELRETPTSKVIKYSNISV